MDADPEESSGLDNWDPGPWLSTKFSALNVGAKPGAKPFVPNVNAPAFVPASSYATNSTQPELDATGNVPMDGAQDSAGFGDEDAVVMEPEVEEEEEEKEEEAMQEGEPSVPEASVKDNGSMKAFIATKPYKKEATKDEEPESKKEHADAGKSAIGGHPMYLTGGVDKRTLEKYEKEAEEKNRESLYLSWALDTNQEERDKGKTVEIGRAYFETEKKHFTILEAPGRQSFVPNMNGGAAQADLAELNSGFLETVESILDASRADKTVKKYKTYISTWKLWCVKNRINELNPNMMDLARYFIDMYNQEAPYSRISTAFFSLKWHFDCSALIMSIPNPCDSKFLKLILDGLKRKLARPVNRKEPITAEILGKIVEKFDNHNVKDLRTCTMFLLGYAGFFRYDELVSIKIKDIKFFKSHIEIFLHKSKTDQYREGDWVVVAATGKRTCPVNMLCKYLRHAGIVDFSTDQFVFCQLSSCKSGNSHKLRKSKLSYARCREILKDTLTAVGEDSKLFGLHSLRAGGATAAAKSGVADRLFKRHGRWATDSSKDRYVKESLSNKMVVSLHLGI